MPLYDYRCHLCGKTFEVRQHFADPLLTQHESCGGELERLISVPTLQFKGTGWYVTDYGKNGKLPSKTGWDGKSDGKSESGGESKSESNGAGKSEHKGESKSENKSESKGENKSNSQGENKSESKGENKSESKPAPASTSSEK